MKKRILSSIIVLAGMMALTGCKVGTPWGTLTVEFDSEAQTEGIHYTDEDGNTSEINTKDVNKQIDTMLESVDLPQDSSTDQLKDFVHSASDTLGVNDTIDTIQDTIDKTTGKTVSEDKVEEEEPRDETDINIFENEEDPIVQEGTLHEVINLQD